MITELTKLYIVFFCFQKLRIVYYIKCLCKMKNKCKVLNKLRVLIWSVFLLLHTDWRLERTMKKLGSSRANTGRWRKIQDSLIWASKNFGNEEILFIWTAIIRRWTTFRTKIISYFEVLASTLGVSVVISIHEKRVRSCITYRY